MVERWGARWRRLVAGAALAAAAAGAWPSVAAVAHDLAADSPAPATLPPLTLPAVTLPAVTLPAVTLPPVTTPGVTTPPVSTPVAEVPSFAVPSVTLPPVAVGGGVPPTTSAPPVAPAVPPVASGVTAGRAPAGELPATVGAGSGAGAPDADAHDGPGAGAPVATTATRAGPLGARLRKAAADTVGGLSFPLGLAAALGCFLLVQHRLDRDDPRMTPAGPADDEMLGFS